MNQARTVTVLSILHVIVVATGATKEMIGILEAIEVIKTGTLTMTVIDVVLVAIAHTLTEIAPMTGPGGPMTTVANGVAPITDNLHNPILTLVTRITALKIINGPKRRP